MAGPSQRDSHSVFLASSPHTLSLFSSEWQASNAAIIGQAQHVPAAPTPWHFAGALFPHLQQLLLSVNPPHHHHHHHHHQHIHTHTHTHTHKGAFLNTFLKGS
jgi:hypothetical protein